MAIVGNAPAEIFSVNGVIMKTGILLALVIAAAAFMWNMVQTNPGNVGNMMPLLLGSCVVGFILALIVGFVPSTAPFISPVYAVVQGVVLGTVSSAFELQPKYQGLTFLAVSLTLGVFVAMLLAYRARIIRPTEKFKSIVIGATMGIMVTYLLSFGLGLAGIKMPFIHDSGVIGIGFSLFVVGLAAMNLILDFDFIEKAAELPAERKMEWYAAFGLLVTLVWLYIEILRLLTKLRR